MRFLLSWARWPPALVTIIFAVVAAVLPDRYTLFPSHGGQVVSAALFALVILSFIAHNVNALHAAERPTAFAFTVIVSLIAFAYFLMIVGRLVVGGSNLKGGPLLEGALAVYALTILAFSLWYWLIDEGRDFLFPQYDSERFENWSPVFTDYLFLAFTTSTAFSPTDVLPGSPRAKLLMMTQSGLSLFTVAIVAARAVNVLD